MFFTGSIWSWRSNHTADRDSNLDMIDRARAARAARAELRIRRDTLRSRERPIKRKGNWIEQQAKSDRTA
jgi:hypothetical protein